MQTEPGCPIVRLAQFRVKRQSTVVEQLELQIRDPHSWEDQVWNTAIRTAIKIIKENNG